MKSKSLGTGDQAPEFTLADQTGRLVSLTELLAAGCLVLSQLQARNHIEEALRIVRSLAGVDRPSTDVAGDRRRS
jgi:hypothetical protein